MPHDKQKEVMYNILFKGKTRVGLEWGRRTGKGEVVIAINALWGQLVPSSQSYYFAPQLNQALEIMWHSGRVETMIPNEWIHAMRQGDHRVWWYGSKFCWWKIDGADKFDKRRGIEPRRGILTIDEGRDIAKGFMGAMKPTLLKWKSPYILTSTPPENLSDDVDPMKNHWLIEEFDIIEKDEKKGYYNHATSYDNPHNSSQWLDDERAEMVEKGELWVFEREYLAKRIAGQSGLVFPMLDPERHVFKFDDLVAALGLDRLRYVG